MTKKDLYKVLDMDWKFKDEYNLSTAKDYKSKRLDNIEEVIAKCFRVMKLLNTETIQPQFDEINRQLDDIKWRITKLENK